MELQLDIWKKESQGVSQRPHFISYEVILKRVAQLNNWKKD